jgi:hypothetical protein
MVSGPHARAASRCTPYDSGVPDLKPPRLNAGERATLHALLQYQRDSLVRKITGVDESAARRSAVDSGTTLLWLVKHLTHAEILWMVCRFGGEDVPCPMTAFIQTTQSRPC